jgi:DNA-directed RNA polymerase subunit RPC12/RpoP
LKVQCPHCGSKLLGCRVIPKHCPDCGKELE